ncbi:ABC transporter permease [Rugosimonospora africana]|uniref:Autoinducer 2 import system permease protein LsrC n=1 Tax=Rugosimonospora africana TaxID=556532 RepID=A0A8J3R2Y9_9ACTN|nr:ABC transporter permease [Rugosimonospora africana]GIH20405.1 ABC transporter permease [Rugosimonospora africana]
MSAAIQETVQPAPVRPSESKRFVERILRVRELALLVVLAVLIVGTELDDHRFLSQQGIKDLLLNAAILVIVATGEATVVITRNVDLSVGSTLGIAAFAAGDYLSGGGNPLVAVLISVLLGAALGLVNGTLVSFGRVPSLVVTLGTLYIIRGVDSIWIGSRSIVASNLPHNFVQVGHGGPFILPYLAIIGVVVLVLVGLFLRSYRSGRELYAIGSSPEAARLAGVATRKRITAAYLFCGALAGLGGALYLARFGNVDSGTGGSYELTVVSAVVVGGVAFTGGSGSVYGAALGAVLLTTINSVLPGLGVNSSWEQAIDGFLLLAAIAVDRLVAVRVANVLRRRNVRHG